VGWTPDVANSLADTQSIACRFTTVSARDIYDLVIVTEGPHSTSTRIRRVLKMLGATTYAIAQASWTGGLGKPKTRW
jgi:hypothetical protein